MPSAQVPPVRVRFSHWRGLALASFAFLFASFPSFASGTSCVDRFAGLYQEPSALVSSRLPQQISGLKRLDSEREWGPQVRLSLGLEADARRATELKRLVVGQYNLLNLVASTEAVAEGQIARPLAELRDLGATIMRAQPDLMVVEEVGSLEILETFSEKFLSGRYQAALIEGNDSRIHVGFLFKKDLPFDVEIQSFRNVSEATENHAVFSRDLPVAVFRERGGEARGPPNFILAGTHYKSQRQDGVLVDTTEIRRNQAEATAAILGFYRAQYGERVPLILAGDFNEDVRVAEAFTSLGQKTKLQCSFDLAPASQSVPFADRITQTFHPRDAPSKGAQLDAILISGITPEEGVVLESQVVPYLDSAGKVKPVPRTYAERRENPSDHFMIRTVLDYEKLRTRR